MKIALFGSLLLLIHSMLICQHPEVDNLAKILEQHVRQDRKKVDLMNEYAASLYQHDHEEMLSMAEAGIELAQKLEYEKGEAEGLRITGIYHHSKSNHKEAREYFQASLDKFQALGDEPGIVRCTNHLGRIAWKLGDYELAGEKFRTAYDMALELGDAALLSITLSSKGILKLQVGDYDEAHEIFRESIQKAEIAGDRHLLVSNLHNIAYIHIRQGNYPEAIDYSKQAITVLKELGHEQDIAGVVLNMGIIYQNQGNYTRAIEHYREAQELYERYGEKEGASMCMNNIGLIHQYQGDLVLALEYIQNSLEIKQETGDRRGMSSCLMNIGGIHSALGSYPLALDYFEKSLAIMEELQEKWGISNCLVQMGATHDNMMDYQSAMKYFQRSLQIKQEVGDRAGIASLWMHMGLIHMKQGRYNRALELSNRSLEIALELELLNLLSTLYKQLSDIYAAQKEYKRAYDMQLLHKVFYDSLFNEEQVRKITGLEYRYTFEKEKQAAELEQQKKDVLIEEEAKQQKILRDAFIAGFTLMALLVLVILLSFRQKRRDNLVLERQKNEITGSISYARRIQHAMFPPEEMLGRLLKESFILHKPRDIVSGDFYWMGERDGKVVIALADCTGHGVPGAFMSLLGIAFLNEIVNSGELHCASDILDQLRSKVILSLHQTGKADEARDGMEMALCIVDTRKKSLQFSGAFRPLLLARNHKVHETRGDKMPIGIYDEKNVFNCHEIKLEESDTLYLFSDGYTDQIGGPRKRSFKVKYFKELLSEIHELGIKEQQSILENKIEAWKGSLDQTDDILVMGFRI